MKIHKKVEVFGDSLLKGIQVNPQNMRYHIDNNIDVDKIEQAHLLSIKNYSKFGCTVTKGFALIDRRLGKSDSFCDAIVMNYGGNDCDFNWKEIGERPDDEHLPNTPLDAFIDTYHAIIDKLKENGIRPILTTLPPLDAQRFFDWFCNGLNKENILKWLGGVDAIYRWQENYSKAVEKIAADTNTLLVDVRREFVSQEKVRDFICEDGAHVNTDGQKLITQAFLNFIEQSKANAAFAT
ncbi:MAG: SGNH/GDSL hydrolase family protein [Oscillospiraceae bacterium]|nr:SGNH/GDSL hydrolase family protein [Oscillospiraceae bacterium]